MKQTDIEQLTEMLDCPADHIVDQVIKLLRIATWVDNEMADLCEDNIVMRDALITSVYEYVYGK